MKNNFLKYLDKYDLYFIFIVLIAIIFIIQTMMFQKKINIQKDTVEVVVSVPIEAGINEKNLKNVSSVYFSNSQKQVYVTNISKNGNSMLLRLRGQGLVDKNKSIFSGEHVGLLQRVKIHGAIEVEGITTSIQKVR